MTIWLCSQYSKDVSCSWRGARKAVDTALRERSDFPGVEALATLKRQCLSPRCSDELASKSRVSSRRAGSAKTVGELTSIPKGLVFKRAGGYLGQHGHPVNFDGHFGRGLPDRPGAYPIDPAHTQRIDLMMMVLGSHGSIYTCSKMLILTAPLRPTHKVSQRRGDEG